MDQALAEKVYRNMFAIRAFEERVEQLFAAGELPGFVHLYIGEEGCAAGVCVNLKPEDYITSTHRGHGHCIAKGGELSKMMAELFAKKTGYNKAKGGSMHLAATQIGILGANGIVGGGVPLATGAALSAKMQKNGRVAVAFFGDGATNQGSVHESMNLAAMLELPIVYVCENNQFGVGTRISEVTRVPDLAVRAQGYGMPGEVVDGQSVLSVYEAAKPLVERARAGDGPAFLEVKTWRFRAHFQGEPAAYRTREEEQQWLQRDPLPIARQEMARRGLMSAERAEQIERAVYAEMEKAVEFGRHSPDPDPQDAMDEIYA